MKRQNRTAIVVFKYNCMGMKRTNASDHVIPRFTKDVAKIMVCFLVFLMPALFSV